MWYEILPSAVIITAALGLPGWGLYHVHNLTLGNHFRRSMTDWWDRNQYQRDMRLTGNPYVVNGLENIPDK
ncbi:NADH dehydrogenase [ubiquinone] 1 alpha subcomplex subunit 1 [Epargyreus clarus]|uniref:NADH dehydrogenase [ubiquinone] 1 alpha subcomplex subunit 1 n=1 Tax=Epargyreus clarus TaxID=520877 RepID=UPI003C2FFEE6